MTIDQPKPWKLLSGAQLHFSEEYHEKPRTEIKPLLPTQATRSLDIGCGTGITSMMLKEIYPSLEAYGIEVQTQAATRAKQRLLGVSAHDLQQSPLPDTFVARSSVDLVLLLDVLEHMYHPWRALENLKPSLAPGATVVASIPNARCLAFLDQIASGSFEYAPYGLFDVTHIRFFTLKNIRAMFDDCGYDVTDTMPIEYPMGMMPEIVSQSWQHVETKNFVIKHDAVEDFNELFAGQWLIQAHPR